MEYFLGSFITLFILYLIKKYKRHSNKKLVEKLMQKCIDRFKIENPETYKRINDLREEYSNELRYSCHIGSYRDGSESDRQDNIQQDKKVNEIRDTLLREVKSSWFCYTVRDVLREHGDDNKLARMIMNYQSDNYDESEEITLISKSSIGFSTIDAMVALREVSL